MFGEKGAGLTKDRDLTSTSVFAGCLLRHMYLTGLGVYLDVVIALVPSLS